MKATNRKVNKSVITVAIGIVLLICGISDALALNDITVRLYDQRELVAGNYTAFCQDPDGFIWIGTDAGLVRFDGNHTDLFRNDEITPGTISDNKIVSLYCDSEGRIWVGTVNGLNYFDPESETFRLVELPGLQLNGFIGPIMENPDGQLLFLVAGIGFYSIDKKDVDDNETKLEAKRLKFGFHDDNGLSTFINIGKGRTLITTRTGEVCIWNPDGKIMTIAKLKGNVNHLAAESKNTVLISTQYEVFRFNVDDESLTPVPIMGGESIKITSMCSAGDATYISTASSGVWAVEKGGGNVVRARGLHSSFADFSLMKVGKLFVDRSGNLWLGCNHKGVAMAPAPQGPFENKSFTGIFKGSEGVEVMCVKVIGDHIVLGLNNGNIVLLDSDGRIRETTVSHGNQVTSIIEWKDGKLLVGVAREGIWSVDSKSLSVSRLVKPSASYPGVVISVGKKGEIVAAFGEIGVLRFDPATGNEKWFYPVGGSNLLPAFYYACLSTSADGKMWIGGYSGLACYDPDSDGLLPINQDPFIKGVVHNVCDYGEGIMIATDRGMLHYSLKKGVIKKYTMADGLPDNDVRTLQPDDKGGMWIGTMKGLAYLKDSESRIQTFGGSFGMGRTSYMFSDRLPLENRLLAANSENLILFNPDSVRQASFGGDVKITGVYINGQRLTRDSQSGSRVIIEGDLAFPDALHLSHDDNFLVLRLSTLDFRDPSDLRYEWQLDGEGDTWHSSAHGESLIYLPQLQSGQHTLRIRGWENDVCSDTRELKLDVKAPWYLSNTAYVAYIVLFVIVGGLVYKVVKNRREEELYEAKIRYFMDISHELRSPVTLMLSPVETLLKQQNTPEATTQLLTMRRNGQRVLNLVDQLLDLRKIEKGKMRLVFTKTDIRAFVEELVDMFRPMAEEKKQTLSFTCNEKEMWGEADRNNLDKILVNLISNAIKYTPDGGKIDVELTKSSDTFGAARYTVTVTDSGIGLDNKVISHLFERFYRNREMHHGNASGFGIGLDLCMRLVELHKGEITAKNREDGVKGSIFSVTLPFYSAKPGSETAVEAPQHRALPDVVTGTGAAQRPTKTSHRFRIMVVDDDEELREYIKMSLAPTYKVTALPNAEAALKVLSEKTPDLIVTDIKMDGIDGISLLRRIKSNMATQHIPVILFSSVTGSDARVKGWKSGADGYLAKPFTVEELEGMISGLLSTRSKLKGKFSGSQETVDNIVAPKVKGIDEDLMDKINRYINDNLSETTMNVDGLSDYVGLSRSQLHRRMKDIMGVAPSDYIRNVKLRKACEMLSHGDVDIAQVAYSLGFNAQSHFSTLFKRYTGMTPTEYRTLGKDPSDVGFADTNENGDKS